MYSPHRLNCQKSEPWLTNTPTAQIIPTRQTCLVEAFQCCRRAWLKRFQKLGEWITTESSFDADCTLKTASGFFENALCLDFSIWMKWSTRNLVSPLTYRKYRKMEDYSSVFQWEFVDWSDASWRIVDRMCSSGLIGARATSDYQMCVESLKTLRNDSKMKRMYAILI